MTTNCAQLAPPHNKCCAPQRAYCSYCWRACRHSAGWCGHWCTRPPNDWSRVKKRSLHLLPMNCHHKPDCYHTTSLSTAAYNKMWPGSLRRQGSAGQTLVAVSPTAGAVSTV